MCLSSVLAGSWPCDPEVRRPDDHVLQWSSASFLRHAGRGKLRRRITNPGIASGFVERKVWR